MEAKHVKDLMETYASIYEGYGKGKKKKKMHDCATHVEHSEYGQGFCIKEQHTMLEDGTVTHYDVEFNNRVVENVPVTELKILASEAHAHEENEVKNAEVLGESDIFDAILEHLVAEGYADTNKAALAIMANMSEEWKQSIVEADSLAAQQARREERLRRQRRREGRPTGGGDFGHNYSQPPAQAEAERKERMRKFINKEN